jgi:hypothetical protein
MMSGPSDDDHGEKRTQAKSAQMASISPVFVQDLSMLVETIMHLSCVRSAAVSDPHTSRW